MKFSKTSIIDDIKKLDEVCGCNEPEEVRNHLVSVKRLDSEDLASTKFFEEPIQSGYYSLPYLTPEFEPVGGFGKQIMRVLFYDDNTAIAIGRFWKYDYKWDHELKMSLDGFPIKKPNNSKNNMEVRFYLLGCNHSYREGDPSSKGLSLFRTEHLYVCEKCDHYYVVDSSD